MIRGRKGKGLSQRTEDGGWSEDGQPLAVRRTRWVGGSASMVATVAVLRDGGRFEKVVEFRCELRLALLGHLDAGRAFSRLD